MEGAIYMQLIRAGLLGVCLVFSAGVNASFELVSRIEGEPPLDRGPNRESNHPAISADGRFVVFLSDASNLPGGFTNPFQDNVFVYDRETDTVKPLTPGADAASFEPAISADGRVIAFSSLASNLITGDTAEANIVNLFVYDLETDTTELLTPGTDNFGRSASLSADGRFVAFTSTSSNLVSGDNNRSTDIFVHDRDTGTTELVTAGSNRFSGSPTISADGRYVAFDSSASNLVAGDTNGTTDIFVYDRATNTTELVTASANNFSENPAISADGQYIVYSSFATNLVSDDAAGGQRNVFVYNRGAGTTKRLTVGDGRSGSTPSISADGQLVTFLGSAFVSRGFPFRNIFVYNQSTESLEQILRNVERNTDKPQMSANGQFVTFVSEDDIRGAATTRNFDVMIYDRATENFERIVSAEAEFEVAGGDEGSDAPSVSGTGRFIAFESNATNLVIGDINGRSDIFVFDRDTSTNERLTSGSSLDSLDPSISSDGQFVAFEARPRDGSLFDNIAATRIFVHDRNTTTTQVLTPENTASLNPSISGDGRLIAFESTATNLAEGDNNNQTSDIFLYDRDTDTIELLTAGGNGDSVTPAISADGRFVAFSSQANNLVANDAVGEVFDIFVYDRLTGTTEGLTRGANNDSLEPAISADGQFVAFESHASNLANVPNEIPNRSATDRDVFVHDRSSNTTTSLTPRQDTVAFGSVSISADGMLVVFAVDFFGNRGDLLPEGNADGVFVHNQATNTTELLTQGADETSNATAISGDGRVIAFSSLALNLVNDGINNVRDVIVSVSNDSPRADSISATTNEDTPLALTITASDPDADVLTFEVLTPPANGELTGTAPDLLYTPAIDFFGTDSFTFSANDGNGSSEPATVSITVTSVNDAPVGVGASIGGGPGITTLRAPADTPFTLTLVGVDVDSDQLRFSIEALPTNGRLSGTAPNIIYTPDRGFLGADSFTFVVNDGDGNSESVTISITVDEATVSLLSAVLPASRSVEVGTTATAFATLINAGTADALACRMRLPSSVAGDFFYQASDPATNALLGEANQPVDIPAGGSQSFVFGIAPSEELVATEVALVFQCANAADALSFASLNTLLLSASFTPVPDLIALAATTTGTGVMELNNNAGFFTAATINVGSAATITVIADTGDATLPMTLSLCQTDPLTSVCINPTLPGTEPVIVDIADGGSPTFAVFANASAPIALDPANSRVFLRFSDESGEVRGATSVAVENAP